MKKIIVFLLTALLMFSVAFADSVPMSKADQMASLVKNFLEENEFPYEYDDYTFTVPFSVDNSMEYAFITVYIYDDMLSVSVDAPIHGTREVFEKMAVFTTLVNNENLLCAVPPRSGWRRILYLLPLLQPGGGRSPRRERAVLPVRHAAQLYGRLRRRHRGGTKRRRSLRSI